MRWRLDWGSRADWLAEAAAERGADLPAAVLDEPELAPGLGWYLDAFAELGSCRPMAMSAIGPIPWTALDAYGRRHGIAGEAFEDFALLIGALDAAWLAHIEERRS